MKRKVAHTPSGDRNIAMCGLVALYMVRLDEFRSHPNRCSNCCRALGDTALRRPAKETT